MSKVSPEKAQTVTNVSQKEKGKGPDKKKKFKFEKKSGGKTFKPGKFKKFKKDSNKMKGKKNFKQRK